MDARRSLRQPAVDLRRQGWLKVHVSPQGVIALSLETAAGEILGSVPLPSVNHLPVALAMIGQALRPQN
jgi:hypothetical protein